MVSAPQNDSQPALPSIVPLVSLASFPWIADLRGDRLLHARLAFEFFDAAVAQMTTRLEAGDCVATIHHFGATLASWTVAGQNMVLGFESAKEYQAPENNAYLGATIGRVANRISSGKVELSDGRTVQVPCNDGKNCLHGGPQGFNTKQFILLHLDQTSVTLQTNIDESDGFPGSIAVMVSYTLLETGSGSSLRIEYEARRIAGLGVINMTHHSYFNLCGYGTIDETEIRLPKSRMFIATNADGTAKGSIEQLPSSNIILKKDTRLDHCIVLDDKMPEFPIDSRKLSLQLVLIASHSSSKFRLTVLTTEPAFQIYTGDGIAVGRFESRSGFAVEPSRVLGDQASMQMGPGRDVYGAMTLYTIDY